MSDGTEYSHEMEEWDWSLLIWYAVIVFMVVNTVGVVIGEPYFQQ